jgi:hypothetical protein
MGRFQYASKGSRIRGAKTLFSRSFSKSFGNSRQLFIVHCFARFIEIQHPVKERPSVNPWDQPSDLRVVLAVAGNADGPLGDRTRGSKRHARTVLRELRRWDFFYKVIVTNGMSEGGDSGSILLSDAGGAVGLLFVRLANPGLDGKNGSGGKLLRTDRPGVDASRRQAEIVQQRRDLFAEPNPKTTTAKTQRIMRSCRTAPSAREKFERIDQYRIESSHETQTAYTVEERPLKSLGQEWITTEGVNPEVYKLPA